MAKSFEQSYAESGRQSELDALGKDPQAYARAKSAYESGGGGQVLGASTTGGGGTDYEAILQRASQMARESAQPAISSYQAQIPEIQARYGQARQSAQQQVESARQRQQQIIDQIIGRESQEKETVTGSTSRELARRGISTSSGLGEREMGAATSGVSRYYAPLVESATLSGQDIVNQALNYLNALPGQETEALRSVQNAIAGLQSGVYPQAASQAMNLYQLGQQQQESSLNRAMQQAQFDADLALRRQQESRLGATAGAGGAIDYAGLLQEFNSQSSPNQDLQTQLGGGLKATGDTRAASRLARIQSGQDLAYGTPLKSGGIVNTIASLFR